MVVLSSTHLLRNFGHANGLRLYIIFPAYIILLTSKSVKLKVTRNVVWSHNDREVACSASDRQGPNFKSYIWRAVSSHSSLHPQEFLLAHFSLYVHKRWPDTPCILCFYLINRHGSYLNLLTLWQIVCQPTLLIRCQIPDYCLDKK